MCLFRIGFKQGVGAMKCQSDFMGFECGVYYRVREE